MRTLKGFARAAGGVGAALAVTLCLEACGSGSTPGLPGTPKPAAATARKVQPGGLSANLVSATTTTRSGPAVVQLKFELRGRPAVADPLDIDLVLLPPPGTPDRISGKVEPGEGIELTDGAELPAVDRPAEGIPLHHSIKVTPKREGVLLVNATVSTELGGQTSTQSFSIPIVVGGAAAPASAPASAAVTRPAAPAGTQPAKGRG